MLDVPLYLATAALVVLLVLAAVGCAFLLALVFRRSTGVFAQVRYVGFFNSASDTCRYCGGCGWFPDVQQRCMSPCVCVTDDKESVTGNL